jgi:hypothetical protein
MESIMVDEASPPTRPRTVWDLLVKECLDEPRRRHVAVPGVDFKQRETFRKKVHAVASARGVRARTQTEADGRLVFWFERK